MPKTGDAAWSTLASVISFLKDGELSDLLDVAVAGVVHEPRVVIRDMGLELSPDVEVRVWDSSAEVR
jgi:hypothetical protein